MPRKRFGGGFSALVLLLGIGAAQELRAGSYATASSPIDSSPTAFPPIETAMRNLAAPAGFRAGDLDLLANYPGTPPKAPPVVARLLRNPLLADTLVPALRRDLRDTTPGGFVRSESLWKWLDPELRPKKAEYRELHEILRDAEESLEKFSTALNPPETDFALRQVPPLFRPAVEDTLLTPIEREIERLRSDAVADSVMRLAERLPMERLADAARDFDAALSRLQEKLRAEGVGATTAYLKRLQKEYGVPVVIGTRGKDVHRLGGGKRGGIVFDPGGDDRYEFPGSATPGSWLMVIDVAGNDAYLARDSAGGAAAFLSVQIIADLDGNDRYAGNDFAFGSALMGFSRLYDASGDDAYEARCASLGFAFRGAGILEDSRGDDAYSAAYLSQAASSSSGFGLLIDREGDDRYETRPVFVDDLRYRDRFLSLSQGFSTGMAPRHAGGIAALWDRAGNDRYLADIFGQGAGYWFAWGLLMDDSGNDSYRAHQYAQGAGVHFAAGSLFDHAGDDARTSKGVSQGCGHDGGFGLLFDGAGNDSTTAVDMSAGAGSANGLGVHIDLSGDDAYAMGNPRMTLGHGDMRRDKGSLGFFLDLDGKDAYPDSASLGNGRAWRVYDGKKRGEGYALDGSR